MRERERREGERERGEGVEGVIDLPLLGVDVIRKHDWLSRLS